MAYRQNYLERDVREVSSVQDLSKFQYFMELCAKRAAQTVNYRALAHDCDISEKVAKAWINILEASYIVFKLPAVGYEYKRSYVKSPKIHFYDSGLLCFLLDIKSPEDLRSSPYFGYIFESWVASEVMKLTHREFMDFSSLSYFRDRDKNEVDLVVCFSDHHLGLVEIKSSADTPKKAFSSLYKIKEEFSKDWRIFTAVIYTGDRSDHMRKSQLISWKDIHRDGWWRRMKIKR